jgi:hypothetical protein
VVNQIAIDNIIVKIFGTFYIWSIPHPIASATLGTMRLVGQMLSMGIAMIIFAVFIGRVEITPEYYISFLKSMNTAFIIFSALCFAGVFVSLARG